MKKQVKKLLRYIEKETSIKFDLSDHDRTYTFIGFNHQLIAADTVRIDLDRLKVMIYSSGEKGCNSIINISIFYGVDRNGNEYAENVRSEIGKVVPDIPIYVFDAFNPKSLISK